MASALQSLIVAPQVSRLPRKSTPAPRPRQTAPTQRTPGRRDEVRNDGGHYVFKVSDNDRLERFLILGTESGRYGVDKVAFTLENANFVVDLIKKGARTERIVRDTTVRISDEGRAYSNSPALFTMAALIVFGQDKAATKVALPKVARTATHLYEYAQYIENLGGWGRAKRESVAGWFSEKTPEQLAYQAVKYRQRNGWTLRDLMRLSHPKGVDRSVGSFILGRNAPVYDYDILNGFKEAQSARTESQILRTLAHYPNLPWEAIPTELLNNPSVWKALFYNGQLKGQAQVRNITRLARNGAFSDSSFRRDFATALQDSKMLEKTRLHPVNLLNALTVYTEGQKVREPGPYRYRMQFSVSRNRKDWSTHADIVDAAEAAFYKSFKYVEPANKNTLVAMDISGSMGGPVLGLDLSALQVGAAIAMTVARTEPWHEVVGFSSGMVDLGITDTMTMAQALSAFKRAAAGSTNIALPMEWAKANKVQVDTFVIVTDNDTNTGRVKPADALRNYRSAMNPKARMAVLGTASSGFTVADPRDRGMMDFAGFDSGAPAALADFSAGRI